MRRNKSKNGTSRGFTLIEVVISIAVLAICSIFILQMFVTSAQLNRNARDIDYANSLLSTIVEGFAVEENVRPREAYAYYDADWNECDVPNARFMVSISVIHRQDGPSVPVSLEDDALTAHGALYEIQCAVLHLGQQGDNVTVAQASSCVYFPKWEDAA